MRDPDVTAIVCSLDNLEMLRRQIPILLGEVGRVIVVNNGSHDGTAAWLAEEAPANVEAITTENRGAGPGRNRGLDAWEEATPYVSTLR